MKKSRPKVKRLLHKTIVHVLTGSIASYKAGDFIQQMRDEGAEIISVLTASAKKFVTPLSIRAISGGPVYDDLFDLGTPYEVLHTSLWEKADLILVAPASANFIARLAAGLADDLATCLILASKRPVVIVPAMNDHMYQHPITQQNLERLKKVGYHLVDPKIGHLVCGREAIGHISDFALILQMLCRLV